MHVHVHAHVSAQVSEISFINTLEAQNRKIEVQERYQVRWPLWGVSFLGVPTPWRDSWGVSCRAAKLDSKSYWMNGRGRKMSSWLRKRQHRNGGGPRRRRDMLNSWNWTRNAKNRMSKWSRCYWRGSAHVRRQQRKNQSECRYPMAHCESASILWHIVRVLVSYGTL